MSFTDFFIKRPVFASVLSLVILLFGIISYSRLSLREYPEIDATTVSITTSYPGASPSIMENLVTTPLENAVANTEGIDYITSSNTQGQSQITIHFHLGYNINAAVSDIGNAVSSVRWQLPQDINDPIIKKDDPNADPVLYIGFSDPNMKLVEVNDYLNRTLQPMLETLPGVGEARVFGTLTYAMRIWLDPYLMAAHGITTQDIQTALNTSNIFAPTGRIQTATQEYDTTVKTDLNLPVQFNNLVLKNDNNNLIRISDVGNAELGAPETRVLGIINGQQSNVMGIIPRTNANPLDVANVVEAELARIKNQLPQGMIANVVWNNAKFIAASIKEVKHTIIEAAIFVILVIFLFLGSMRTILIPAVTIPLSLIGVCTLLYAMNYSLNTLTFLAFVLAIGMVVDDAIVVAENIHRNIELGKSPFEAALIGAREIRFAIIAMTFTLAAVYAPILFMSGITGALFKEFAFTLACAVILSGFIALTLSPMMCSKILRDKSHENKFEIKVQEYTDKISQNYRKLLSKTLTYPKVIAGIIIVMLLLCGILYKITPQELAPKEDEGGLMTVITAPSSANIDYTKKYVSEIDNIYKTVPEGIDRLFIIGYPDGVNTAISFLTLKDWSKRHRSVGEIIGSLMPKMMSIPGVLAFPLNPFRLPGSGGFYDISLVIKTTGDYQELDKVVQNILQAAKQAPALANVDSDLKIDKPQINLTVNRNLAADLGISMSDIGNAINIAIGEPQFNRFEMNGRSYYVIPQLMEQYRDKPDTLNNLYLRTTSGNLVPMSSFVSISQSVVPQSLNHFQQMRAATLNASTGSGYTQGQAITALEQLAKKYMKPDMSFDFSGQSRQFMQASGSLEETFIFALLFIFLVLAAQFESFRDPLIVMFSVPLSTAGALILLKLFGGTMNIYTQIGLITLIGLISKHGILMVEFANQLQRQGKSKLEAIINSAVIRLRPILMTTAAMVLGAVPLALASGAGANSRHQIGLVIIGGMSIGTLLTLFVVPMVYTWLATRKVEEL